ncbi:hypothetical protein APED_27470 [Acanthopleuribacter pedis]
MKKMGWRLHPARQKRRERERARRCDKDGTPACTTRAPKTGSKGMGRRRAPGAPQEVSRKGWAGGVHQARPKKWLGRDGPAACTRRAPKSGSEGMGRRRAPGAPQKPGRKGWDGGVHQTRPKNRVERDGTPACKPLARQRRAGFQPWVGNRREAGGALPMVHVPPKKYAGGVPQPRRDGMIPMRPKAKSGPRRPASHSPAPPESL